MSRFSTRILQFAILSSILIHLAGMQTLAAWTITRVEETGQETLLVLDGGYEEGLVIGTLLEIFRTETVATAPSDSPLTREVFVGVAVVAQGESDWCLAEAVGIPTEAFQGGQQVRIKERNTVRYVAASQKNLLIDLNARTAQSLQRSDVLEVFHPMQCIHPITQTPITWRDPIGEMRIIHTTPNRFTARASAVRTIKPILAGDFLELPKEKQIPQQTHIVRILDGTLYLNSFPEAAEGGVGVFRLSGASSEPRAFKIRAIYEHLVAVECADADSLNPGDVVEIELEGND